MKKKEILYFGVLIIFLTVQFVSANILEQLQVDIIVCVNSSLEYSFNLSEEPSSDFLFEIYPKNPFFIRQTNGRGLEIFSGILTEENIGIHAEKILVYNDGAAVEKTADISVVEDEECANKKISNETCSKKFGCGEWNLCQDLEQSFAVGVISEEDYNKIKKNCGMNRLENEVCGFQIRECFDVNKCNETSEQPERIQSCYFTIEPTCSDGIKNCHGGSCEFLVDCGGLCDTT